MSEEQTVKKVRKSKPDGITKVIRVELTGYTNAESACLWAANSEFQQVANDYYSHWLRLHQEAGDHIAVREWIQRDKEYAKTYNKKKKDENTPKRASCPVMPVSNEMCRKLYKCLCEEHSGFGTKPIGYIMDALKKTLTSATSSKSAYKRWMIILSGLGELPQTKKGSIPFYVGNSKFIAPVKANEPWKFELRLEKMIGASRLTAMTFKMKTGGRKLGGIREALWKMNSGRWLFSTSRVVNHGGKWYAHICYKIPDTEITRPNLDGSKTAFITAGKYHTMMARINGMTDRYICDHDGELVGHVRESLTRQRFGKNESYKYASSARKNHGRGTVDYWQLRIRHKWRDTVKGLNDRFAAKIIKRCVSNGIGNIVIYQPTEKWLESRFLVNVGKTSGCRESSGWDWFQMIVAFQHAAKVVGIKVDTKKIGEKRKKEKEAA
jgi:hypothetical protein